MKKILPGSSLPVFAVSLLLLCFSHSTNAQTVITESDISRQPENTAPTNNWVGYTRTGTPPSSIAFISGPAPAPLGCGSLLLTTVLGSEKAFLFNYDHVGKSIADIDAIMYSTYRVTGNLQQVAALNVQIDYNGSDPGGFSTLVYEPVYNPGDGMVVSGTWQTWNAMEGIWWSTQPINGQCAGATAGCDKTWAEIVANNPDATILAVGINQGSGNPGLSTAVDAFTFDEDTYNFEPSTDSDGDGSGDICDLDDDNDGVPDEMDCDPLDGGNDKVLVCHKGQTLCISQNALDAHLRHGDQAGPCAAERSVNPAHTVNVLPAQFGLANFPNPFKGGTKIQYSLPVASKVSIRVYDLLGRELNVLVNADKPAGIHVVNFDGSKLGKGIYFCRLFTDNELQKISATTKLIILE